MTLPPLRPHAEGGLDPALEPLLADVEARLQSLGEALRLGDAAAIESHAGELHRALARTVDRFALAARRGDIPAALRQRLARAGGQVAAQREALARATAALDRAIDVLFPPEVPALYSSLGGSERSLRGGSVQA